MGEPIVQRVSQLHEQKCQQFYDKLPVDDGLCKRYRNGDVHSDTMQIVLGETRQSANGGRVEFRIFDYNIPT